MLIEFDTDTDPVFVDPERVSAVRCFHEGMPDADRTLLVVDGRDVVVLGHVRDIGPKLSQVVDLFHRRETLLHRQKGGPHGTAAVR